MSKGAIAGERRPLIDTAEASARLGVSARTLERWRYRGKFGPPYTKLLSGAVRYSPDDLDAWLSPGRKAA